MLDAENLKFFFVQTHAAQHKAVAAQRLDGIDAHAAHHFLNLVLPRGDKIHKALIADVRVEALHKVGTLGCDAPVALAELKVPKPKDAVFESAVIERYRRREQSVEKSSTDMCLAGADSYETRSVIFTSNLEFSRWGDVFGDGDMAAAVIDRIVHHGRILRFHGESYRNKHSLMK